LKIAIILSGFLLLLSYVLTYVIRRVALRHKILDVPNERSSHITPVPRGGGLAIVVSWYIGISILFFSGFIESNLYFAMMSGILLAIVSLIDDIFTLNHLVRIVIQTITALIAFICLDGINPILISGLEFKLNFILYPLTIIGIVWFINLFNFLDGIDGYASIEAIMIAFFMFLFSGSYINLILISCILGFLIWNWPKALIFMGDIGSTQLGFVLVILGIYFHNELKLSIVYWILLSSLFWFDATLTLYRRWKNKEHLSQAHKKHIYQRAVQSGFSHEKIIYFAIIINIIIVGLVYSSLRIEVLLVPVIIFILFFLFGITLFIDRRFPFR
jgi:UDP-N-acetylmuramyl pentapeptide phosphotransferase/UDP-N-acetylglucosamine-1-phosphate transferase